jgi:hypothetical protein
MKTAEEFWGTTNELIVEKKLLARSNLLYD